VVLGQTEMLLPIREYASGPIDLNDMQQLSLRPYNVHWPS